MPRGGILLSGRRRCRRAVPSAEATPSRRVVLATLSQAQAQPLPMDGSFHEASRSSTEHDWLKPPKLPGLRLARGTSAHTVFSRLTPSGETHGANVAFSGLQGFFLGN